MKKYNKFIIMATCVIVMNLNCQNSQAADYTGGMNELLDTLNSAGTTDSGRNFFQNTSITIDANLPNITSDGSNITIMGNHSDINGAGFAGLTVLAEQTLNISNVGLLDTDGSVLKSYNGFRGEFGAAIDNSGTTTVSNSVFQDNISNFGSGAISNNGGTLNLDNVTFTGNYSINGYGGAILNNGVLTNTDPNTGNSINESITSTIRNSTFEDNQASLDGGAISNNGGTLNLDNVTFTGNYSVNGYGGAISNYGILPNTDPNTGYSINESITSTIRNSTFENNHSLYDGGAIYNDKGTLNIDNVTFRGNYSESSSGGAIYNYGILANTDPNTGNSINESITSTIQNATFENNHAAGDGGAIYNCGGTLNISSDSTFTGNQSESGSGGAIYNYGILPNTDPNTGYSINESITSTIRNSTFENNHSLGDGGAIYNDGGTLNISDSTFTGNQSESGSGGAIYNYGILPNTDPNTGYSINESITSTIRNSTFENNHASQDGGAIFNNGGTLNISNDSTFMGNHADNGNGGAIYNDRGTLNIDHVDFTGNYAVAGSGGAIYNFGLLTNTDPATGYNVNESTTLTIRNSTFENNHADQPGGAISNFCGTLNLDNVTFTGNSTSRYGGAINNYGILTNTDPTTGYDVSASTTFTIKNSTFENNHAYESGGAIQNQSAILNIDNVTFRGNYSETAGGGAINNDGTLWNIDPGTGDYVATSVTSTIQNSTFENNHAYQDGGAIYNNGGILNIIDSTFTGNHVDTGQGGAIYNTGNGVLNIQATANGITSFTGNTDGYGSNAIHMANGILNLDAFSNGKIIFNDKITSDQIVNTININVNSLNAGNPGEVIFNQTVSDSTINLSGGILTLGQTGSNLTNTYLSNVNLNLNGGVLNLENGKTTDVLNLNTFYADYNASLRFDANLSTGENDTINILDGTGNLGILNIRHLNIVAEGAASTLTLFSGGISPILMDFDAYTNNHGYAFTASITPGVYNISTFLVSGLLSAVKDPVAYRSFSALTDETISRNLGDMYGANSTLDIFGHNNNINGAGFSGINVLAGQTLNISDVGLLDTDGTVLKSYNGFWGNFNGGVVYNSGTTTITNSVFQNNATAYSGGVAYNNKGTLNISGSTFNQNTSYVYPGGVIYNNEGELTIDNSSFTSNNALNDAAGAIYNNAGVLTITNSTFTDNRSGGSGYGGAISNFLGELAIDHSNFIANFADNGSGGSIYNYGQLNYTDPITGNNINEIITSTINNSTFENNHAFQDGGAIYNDCGAINLDNVTFIGNHADNGGGGAIYNSGILSNTDPNTGNSINESITFTIQNSTFENNHSLVDGGAIYNDRGTLNISDSTFTGNRSEFSQGGAIYNSGILSNIDPNTGNSINESITFTIQNSTFENNHSLIGGGAIYNDNGTLNIDNVIFRGNYSETAYGGAIYSYGILANTYPASGDTSLQSIPSTIQNSTFENNHSLMDGGAIHNYCGTLNIVDSSFTGNYSESHSGGAIGNYGVLGNYDTNTGYSTYESIISTIQNSTFEDNHSGADGGAIYNDSGTLNIDNVIFRGNYSENGSGGAIYNYGALSNTDPNTGYSIITSITSTIQNSTFENNHSGADGGAIYNDSGTLNISDSTFTENYSESGQGGAISNSGGALNISGSTFTGNYSAIGGGGAINNSGISARIDPNTGYSINESITSTIQNSTFDTNHAVNDGGAIYNYGGTLNINDSTFTGNYSESGSGGAISIYGILANTDSNTGYSIITSITPTIQNSTFQNNHSVYYGGAIFNGSGILNIDNVTFRGNNSESGSGGAIYNSGILACMDLNIGNNINESITSTIQNSTFENNHSLYDGGAIFNDGGTLNIDNVTFRGNYSESSTSGAIYNYGILSNTDPNTGYSINESITFTIQNSTFENNHSTGDGGAIYNDRGTLNIDNVIFRGNYSESGKGGAIYNSGILSNTDPNTGYSINESITSTIQNSTFENSHSGADGGAIYNDSGILNINNVIFRGNYSENGQGGAIYNSGVLSNTDPNTGDNISESITSTIRNSAFENNHSMNDGGAIYNDGGTINIVDSSFTGNHSDNGLGGVIYNRNNGILNIQAADNGVTSFTNNTDSTGSNAIYLDSGTLNLNAGNNGQIIFNDKIASSNITNPININKTGSAATDGPPTGSPTSGNIYFNNSVSNSTINLYNGTVTLGQDNYLNGNNLGLYGGTLNMVNNSTGIANFNNLSLTGTTNLRIDADLKNEVADKITSANPVTGTGILNVNHINLLSDATTNTTNLLIADNNVKGYVQVGVTDVESPLYKYNLSYNSSSGTLGFENTHNFSPSILTPQVATMTGTYLTQTNTYAEAFGNLDSIMFMSKSDRLLMECRNKTADADGQFVFSPTLLPEEKAGIWVKQFTTFENIPLNNGPNVSNVGYGTLVGADSEIKPLGRGFRGYVTAYMGYNGSHQNYDNVGAYQNGGLLGLTGTVYKGNFFAALTANTGASVGNTFTTYGTDTFTTLLAGTALKTGYNFELFNGKMIIQPSYTMSYSFAKTFDYTAASGADITSSPLNAIQIIPGIKLIGNLKNGWQPYLGVNMAWNIMDSAKFYANDVQLPQLSVAPYVEYGVGIQRKWGERFTGFGQAMARGGGRNGVALQFGFRFAI